MTKCEQKEVYIPDFVEGLTFSQVQPWHVARQGNFISIRQRDETNEFIHWAMIPIDNVGQFVADVLLAAGGVSAQSNRD